MFLAALAPWRMAFCQCSTRMCGQIPDGSDWPHRPPHECHRRWWRSAHPNDAVINVNATALEEVDGRFYPDAHHNDLTRDPQSALCRNRFHAMTTFESRDRVAEILDTVRFVQRRKRRANRFAKNSSQWGIAWIDGGDFDAFVAERGRYFATDESHADDDGLAAWTHRGAQSIRIMRPSRSLRSAGHSQPYLRESSSCCRGFVRMSTTVSLDAI